MAQAFNLKYPSIDDLRKKAKRKMPKFAFEYLDGGCNDDINLKKNTSDIRAVELIPNYLKSKVQVDLKTTLFGETYDAPFGVAPIGLQGLMWPKAPEILAHAAKKQNLPFVLSTVTTSSIEKIGKISEGKAWFQLYHPAKKEVRDDLIERASNAGYPVLVLLSDVPTFGFRPRDIRNGLAMPPKMSINNFIQILKRPEWALKTLMNGQPQFESLLPYMPKGLNLNQLGKFMDATFDGRLNEEKIKPIRDLWKGKIVLKGVASSADMEKAISLGIDGVIISNHGGRQLDAGQSTLHALQSLNKKYEDKITIMMDSGLRSGPDVARTLASGAKFTFMGRSFMYGVGALGSQGGEHTMELIKTELRQVMDQIGCEKTSDFPNFLVK
ncbi:alpha-hydroxy-acid oxidizing protein [bacterium]|jgi:L-lactate dehydrogenase (cytochrome)|nr:alpha-hydroxy-acid oxidizing protein [bacterium]MDC0125705.1 alpha-hydroxy-acid oxidizing protein [Flavobacteriaceae bacterium]|tara:strand:- start:11701 stop:12849 length:1149 start_codon:yes stop_codon:yes gene_type:complete